LKTDRVLEDIKSKIDIVDFISGHVQLKKAGQNWKGLCPFHSEKTPSFTVNQAKQIFHCFGCGVGGDVISFAMKSENLSFNEALTMLAKKAGIPFVMGKIDQKTVQKSEQIRSALSEAANFFVNKLAGSKTAKEYLEERGINKESLEMFRLGYAPAGWDNLLKHLRNSGFTDQTIKDAGLAVAGTKGLYDMFRERMIFPIMSINSNVVAFGARALDNSLPKYINSPETPVFNKSATLFGLDKAKEAIIKQNNVLLVEGYMDVIICYQYGFKNVVAPLGTSLTAGHLQKLRTLTNNTTLIFDGDAAGIAAARRALSLICQNGFQAKILLLPEKEDPDSYLRKHGGPSFGTLIENSKSIIDFIFSISGSAKTDTIREVLTLIAELKDILVADEMLTELTNKTRVHESTIRQEFKNISSRRSGISIEKRDNPSQPDRSGIPSGNPEEYLLLSAVVAFPEKTDYLLSHLDLNDIKDKIVVSIFNKLSALTGEKDPAYLLDTADEDERKMITRLSVDPGFDPAHIDKNIEDCLKRIENRKLNRKIRNAEISGDLKLLTALVIEKKKNIKEPVI